MTSDPSTPVPSSGDAPPPGAIRWSAEASPPGHDAPPLSVIVPTRYAPAAIAPALDALVPQALACGAEIVLVDGRDDPGDETELPACVRRVAAPGRDVFGMRAVGVGAARGEVVAITEDHCVTDDDFCAATLRAHRETERLAVAGAVVNGSARTALDRANFLVVHGDNLPGRQADPPDQWIPSSSNVSYKRAALPGGTPERGWLEVVLNTSLTQRGEVCLDDRAVVSHVQSLPGLGHFANHFHASRTFGALARRFAAPDRPARWCMRSAAQVATGLVRRVRRVARQGRTPRRDAYALLPLAVGLVLAGTAGFVVGALAGPGRSPLLQH